MAKCGYVVVLVGSLVVCMVVEENLIFENVDLGTFGVLIGVE